MSQLADKKHQQTMLNSTELAKTLGYNKTKLCKNKNELIKAISDGVLSKEAFLLKFCANKDIEKIYQGPM